MIIIGLFFIGGSIFGYEQSLRGKILPHVFVGDIELSKQSIADGSRLLEERVRLLESEGLRFQFQNQTFSLPFGSSHPDIFQHLIEPSIESTASEAYAIGRKGNLASKFSDRIQSLFSKHDIPFAFQINEDMMMQSLEEIGQKEIIYPVDASFIMDQNQLVIREGEKGRGFDRNGVLSSASEELSHGRNGPIPLAIIDVEPEISSADLHPLRNEAEQLISGAPVSIRYLDYHWKIEPRDLAKSLGAISNHSQTSLSFSGQGLEEIFKTIEKTTNSDPKEGKFEMVDGKVIEFQIPENGRRLDRNQTIGQWEKDFLIEKKYESSLVVEELFPKVTADDLPNLGITEIIGVGESDFKGSPKNRKTNIGVGSAKIHGTLIGPNEEFSLLFGLGDFGPEDGWLPELVIKGDKTIPEFGGGACQFGTTMFRAAMDAGLKILERQNHSYTVSYYYPIGTDATIYHPKPDFRFLNDTGHSILIQTKIIGDTLRFELWGTKDGRKVKRTDPVLSNWVNPPPTKNIETPDIAPGEKKCVEKSHKGVSAVFDYIVTSKEGVATKTTFKSKYKPWQEVCLIGRETKPLPE